MPVPSRYPAKPDVVALLKRMQADIAMLKTKVANLGAQPGGTPGDVYDGNVLFNGRFEGGYQTTWMPGRFVAGYGGANQPKFSIEEADPLDGLRSFRADELASAASWMVWLPSHQIGAPIVGQDVFATAPGEQWRCTAKLRSSVNVSNANTICMTGATPLDAVSLDNGGTATWVRAVDTPLVGGVTTDVDGTAVIPAGHHYVGFAIVGATIPPATPYTWWCDGLTMQRKLS